MRLMLDAAYLLLALLASPWILYRLVATADRQTLASRLGGGLGAPVARSIWLHGASVGEVALLRPLVERLESDQPDVPLVISAFTATGLAAARKSFPRHRVILLPLDLSAVVRRFLRHFDPRLVVIVESELWPNFLDAARRRGVPVAVLNGKMSPKARRVHARLGLLPRLLRGVALVAVQNEEHAGRFESLGVERARIRVTGNMKYDLAHGGPGDEEAARLRRSLGYDAADVVLIGGSLHEGEDEALLDAVGEIAATFPALAPRLATIVVPRYPAEAGAVERHARARGLDAVRKSAVDHGGRPPGRAGVLVVDTLGELGRLYAVADVAFVGGSLYYRGSNKGGHNLMEPAILGVPVLFGPYNFSFRETVAALLDAGGGVLVRDRHELARALERLAGDVSARREMGERARRVVLDNQGAAQRNYRLLKELLSEQRLPASAPRRTMPRPARDHPESS